ncbi:MAG: hypothetical protein M1832_000270 [Thelocarpon impressellum]|nr:MAG: hypothetical protein M1832_000270 [Thelocarpon impressellum]
MARIRYATRAGGWIAGDTRRGVTSSRGAADRLATTGMSTEEAWALLDARDDKRVALARTVERLRTRERAVRAELRALRREYRRRQFKGTKCTQTFLHDRHYDQWEEAHTICERNWDWDGSSDADDRAGVQPGNCWRFDVCVVEVRRGDQQRCGTCASLD